jgi:MSHA biogenesis protein MshJ
MMNSITELMEKIDNLTIRERAAILVGVLAVLYTMWNMFLMQPLANEQKIIRAELQQKQATLAGLNAQAQKIIEDNSKDPNIELEKNLQVLKAELNEINANIQVSTAHLVSPKNMAKILETVLLKTKVLTLVSAKGLGANALIQQDKDQKAKDGSAEVVQSEDMSNAYRHGLRIEFEGDFMSTLRYLKELESLDWKFFWDSFEFNVEDYPKSRVSIEVFTLSLDKNWIDV